MKILKRKKKLNKKKHKFKFLKVNENKINYLI